MLYPSELRARKAKKMLDAAYQGILPRRQQSVKVRPMWFWVSLNLSLCVMAKVQSRYLKCETMNRICHSDGYKELLAAWRAACEEKVRNGPSRGFFLRAFRFPLFSESIQQKVPALRHFLRREF